MLTARAATSASVPSETVDSSIINSFIRGDQRHRVGRGERRRRVEREKEVVDVTRFSVGTDGPGREHHVRKDELGWSSVITPVEPRAAPVEHPVPDREDDDVRGPDVQRIQQQRPAIVSCPASSATISSRSDRALARLMMTTRTTPSVRLSRRWSSPISTAGSCGRPMPAVQPAASARSAEPIR